MKKLEKLFPLILVVLAFTLYAGTLDNDFLVVDDYDGYVYNETIQDIGTAFKSLDLNNILYAITYKLFGLNPTPLHVMSIALHGINAILGFFILKELFSFRTAAIATVIFVVHPINSEAISWISGRVYLYLAMFSFAVLLPYIKFKKTGRQGYLFLAAEIYFVSLFIYRNIWLMLVPLLTLVVDRAFIHKKFDFKNLKPVGLLFAVAFSFLLISGPFIIEHTINHRLPKAGIQGISSNYGGNQEAFTPVLESYPYTTYSLVKTLIFPNVLTFYYNGNPIEGAEYALMYFVFAAYIAGTIVAFKKDIKIGATLVLIPLLVAPTYSPIKVTWFFTERYVYTASLFFGLLVALLFSKLKNKKYQKAKYTLLAIVIILFSVRTYVRTQDWQNTITFSEANIKSAPYTERPYSDLGAYYLTEGEKNNSLKNYNKALTLNRQSETPINAIGLILLNYGPDSMEVQRELSYKVFDSDTSKTTGGVYYSVRSDLKALYFLNENLIYHPNDIETLKKISEIYRRNGQSEFAKEIFPAASSQ